MSFGVDQRHGESLAREARALSGLMPEDTRDDIAGLADVQGVVGAAEYVDVVHGKTTMPSSSGEEKPFDSWTVRLRRTAHSLRGSP